VLFVAACGGGSSDKKAASTTTAPKATTAQSTTTTTFLAPSADAARAKNSAITLADLGPQWSEYKAATGPSDGANDVGCGVTPGGPLSKVGFGASYGGPQAKFKSNASYEISAATVFPDEATARAWVAIRKSAAFKACRAKEFDAGAKTQDPKFSVVLLDTKDPAVGRNGYEDFARYQALGPDKTGKLVPSAYYDTIVDRVGRVVISTRLEHAASVDAAGQQAVTEAFNTALDKAYARAR
jgi:hypothetical protein